MALGDDGRQVELVFLLPLSQSHPIQHRWGARELTERADSGGIMASDILKSGFAPDPMSLEAGRRYRDIVLKRGGSQPEMETVTEYLGRPNAKAHFERLGF